MKCRAVNSCVALKTIYYQFPLEIFLLLRLIYMYMHNTRTKDHYRTDFALTNSRLFSIKCSGPIPWNSLPAYIRKVAYSLHNSKNQCGNF